MSPSDTVPNRNTSRHVVIGGGSGFIGSALAHALRSRGDRVTLISRRPGPERITWDHLERDGLPPPMRS